MFLILKPWHFPGTANFFVDYFIKWMGKREKLESFDYEYAYLEYNYFRPCLYPRNPFTSSLRYECKVRFSQVEKQGRQMSALSDLALKASDEECERLDSVCARFLQHPAFTREIAIGLDCSDPHKLEDHVEAIMQGQSATKAKLDTLKEEV